MISEGLRIDNLHNMVRAISWTAEMGSFIHRNSFLKLFGEFKYGSKFSFREANIVYLISYSVSEIATFMNLSRISYITFFEIIYYPTDLLFFTYSKHPALAVALRITGLGLAKFGSTASFTNIAKLSC